MSDRHSADQTLTELLEHLDVEHGWDVEPEIEPGPCDTCGDLDSDLYGFREGPARYVQSLCRMCASRAGRMW